jgi:hypothetical protein
MARRLMPVHGLSVKQHLWLRKKWHGMQSRCRPDFRWSKNYHERGIRVAWEAFKQFAEYVRDHLGFPDLESGTKWTLDRIDNDVGYQPGNIRWATYTENLRNRRGGVYVTYKGERVLLAELADRAGLSYYLVHDRISRQGWTAEEAVETPLLGKTQRLREPVWKHERTATYNGTTKRLREWAREHGIKASLLRDRLDGGWDFEAAIGTASHRGNASARRAERFLYHGKPMLLAEIAQASKIGVDTLRYRIKKMRLTPEQAVARGGRLGTSASSQRKTDLMAEK